MPSLPGNLNPNFKHGLARTPIYVLLRNIKSRCYNKNNKRYKDYGGRGITVCEEWQNIQIFHKWCIENGFRKGLSIDRINNNGNYEPGNCRFTTMAKQNRNRRDNTLMTFNGKTQCLTDWAIELNLNYDKLHARIRRGWTVEKALNT